MLKNVTTCFAVVYIPFYALQCARQKRLLEESARGNNPLGQLSFPVLETDLPKVAEPGRLDDTSSDLPAGLLDPEGIHVIELNHAAAVSMVDGPARALDLIDALQARGALDGYELLPAVRADLLRRLGRREAAREAYLAATAATQLEPLRRLYARRLAELDG